MEIPPRAVLIFIVVSGVLINIASHYVTKLLDKAWKARVRGGAESKGSKRKVQRLIRNPFLRALAEHQARSARLDGIFLSVVGAVFFGIQDVPRLMLIVNFGVGLVFLVVGGIRFVHGTRREYELIHARYLMARTANRTQPSTSE